MSWFLAIRAANVVPLPHEGAAGTGPTRDLQWKAVSRTLHATRKEAEAAAAQLRSVAVNGAPIKVMDADHEPGRSILRSKNPFS